MTNPRTTPVFLALLACAGILVMFSTELATPKGMVICVAISLLAAVAPAAVNRQGIGLGPVYAGFYWVFHFGILAPVALGFSPRLFNPGDEGWATQGNLAEAAIPAAMFLVAFSAAFLVGSAKRREVPATDVESTPNVETRAFDGPAIVGLAATVLGLAVWSQIFAASGAGITGSYVQFLAATQGSATPYAYLLISAGMATIGASRNKSVVRAAFCLFALWSVPAFLLGLRGEVLIPLLAFAVSRSRSQGLSIRRRWVVLGAAVGLSGGALVRVLRVGGAADWSHLNPMNGLVELGYTIRPMIVVQDVHASLGETHVGASTYLAPLERLFIGRLLGWETTPAALDQDVFGTFIASRFGPIGGSVSAEAFRSGALLGVAVVALLLGLIVGRLDVADRSPVTDAFVGCVAGITLLWIRNDFTPVPLSILIVLLMIVSVRLMPARAPDDRSSERKNRVVRG